MKRKARPRPARGVLLGAIKWIPILLIPFSAFFFQTWLQLQIFHRDYEAAELLRQIKEVNLRIDTLEERADELMTIEKLSAQAPDLGLVQPEPSQIEVVYVSPREAPLVEEPSYAIASLPHPEPNRPVRVDADPGR